MRTIWLAAAAALLSAAAPPPAGTLVDNVNGYTLDASGRLIRFTGLVVDDDGKVKALLDRKDKRPERPSFRLDGKGQTLVPGMIDAHGHVMALGFQAMQLDLSGATSLADAQTRIAAYAAANPTPRWIVGRGWDQERWGLGRFPTAQDLDAAVPGRPVWLVRIDGHAGWANSLAMKEAGVGSKSVAPIGGRIETSSGQPAGVFVDAAMALVQDAVPPPLPRTNDEAFLKAQQLALSSGLTTVTDMGTDVATWNVIRRAGDRGALSVRVIAYASGVDSALAVAGSGPTPWLYGGKLRMIGVKLHLDGSLGARGAWLKQDYRDAAGQLGLPRHNDAALKNLMSRAAMDGLQVAVDAVGDAANTQLLDAIEELGQTYKGDRRWRIEQAAIVDPADLSRFAGRAIVASMQPAGISDWRMTETRLGVDRLGGALAWASMIHNKVPLAFGSQFPTYAANPFAGLAAAIGRADPQGQPPGGWMPQQRVTLDQAFAAFTRGAAYAAFAEDRLGTLEKGKLADFLIIDRDIFAGATPDQIRATQVLETWIAGRRVWQRKEVSSVLQESVR